MTATTANARLLPTDRALRALRGARRFWPVILLDAAMVIAFAIWQPVFFTWTNFQDVLTSMSIIWMVAMGMTFVLISGGFDLSAGAVATVSGIVLAKMLSAGVPGLLAILLAVAVGGLIGGAINGVLIGKLGLSVFVVTLGSMTALTGVASLWTNTLTLPVTNSAVVGLVTRHAAGLPIVVWVMIGVFLITLYLQRMTHFGRDVFAVGASMVASRLSGIRTGRVLICVYLFVGLCAGLGGVIAVGRIGGAAPQVDNTLALQAIAAVLLGGTSLAGGLGGVGGTVFGVLFIGILQNGLSLAGVQTFWQQVITGVILVAAVTGDRLQRLGWISLRRGNDPAGPPLLTNEAPDMAAEPAIAADASANRSATAPAPDGADNGSSHPGSTA